MPTSVRHLVNTVLCIVAKTLVQGSTAMMNLNALVLELDERVQSAIKLPACRSCIPQEEFQAITARSHPPTIIGLLKIAKRELEVMFF